MFVQHNDLSGIKAYFSQKLADLFTESEIRSITKQVVLDRMKIDSTEYLIGDLRFSESDLLHFRSIIRRLLKNEPLQHVLGSVHFCQLELISDKRALIPRPETEELVQWIREESQNQQNLKIVDICAGSGCIALAVKDYLPNSNVIALELSDDALNLIEENKNHTGLEIEVHKFDALKDDYSQFSSADVIVSNPPYIPTKDKAFMAANVLDFEPDMALFVSDDDPLVFYREIGIGAMTALTNQGWLYFEIHEDLGNETLDLLKKIGFVNTELRKDLQGKDRMIRAQKVLS